MSRRTSPRTSRSRRSASPTTGTSSTWSGSCSSSSSTCSIRSWRRAIRTSRSRWTSTGGSSDPLQRPGATPSRRSPSFPSLPRPPPPRIEVRTVKALAARRHHPMALLVILLLALVATGGLYAALSPQTAQAEAYSEDDVKAGEALFLANCATCHGRDAEGLVDSGGTTIGPSLIGVGAA